MTPHADLVARLRKFVTEYRKIKRLDPDMVYALHSEHEERFAPLLLSDLEAAAEALAALPPPADPPALVALVREIQTVVAEEAAEGYQWSTRQGDLLERLLAYPLPAAPPVPEGETQHWSVSVDRNGANLVVIESNALSGQPEFSDEDARVIRECAAHLLAFVGPAAPPVPETPQGWQPIETAPKDGTAVLGYFGNSAGEDYCDHAIVFYKRGDWWLAELSNSDTGEVEPPTHWQPLPAAPAVPPQEGR